jgi:hypothetical protein
MQGTTPSCSSHSAITCLPDHDKDDRSCEAPSAQAPDELVSNHDVRGDSPSSGGGLSACFKLSAPTSAIAARWHNTTTPFSSQ